MFSTRQINKGKNYKVVKSCTPCNGVVVCITTFILNIQTHDDNEQYS